MPRGGPEGFPDEVGVGRSESKHESLPAGSATSYDRRGGLEGPEIRLLAKING